MLLPSNSAKLSGCFWPLMGQKKIWYEDNITMQGQKIEYKDVIE